jgi:topoisomerase (DNA) II binding protein 1
VRWILCSFVCLHTNNVIMIFLFKDGSLLDVDSHILYSPLPCRAPLPGFESLWFCVSQYDEKDRILLWNLCKALGAKFSVKLTQKVTHLLCKFTNGPKYEASCKWGIRTVTSEWIFECVKQVLYLLWLRTGQCKLR